MTCYDKLANKAFRYLLRQQRGDGSFPHSQRDYGVLSDRRPYPRYLAMMVFHLVTSAQDRQAELPDNSGNPFDREIASSFLDLVGESIDRAPREVWLIINELQYPDLLESNRHYDQTDLIVYGASQFFVYHHRVESRA